MSVPSGTHGQSARRPVRRHEPCLGRQPGRSPKPESVATKRETIGLSANQVFPAVAVRTDQFSETSRFSALRKRVENSGIRLRVSKRKSWPRHYSNHSLLARTSICHIRIPIVRWYVESKHSSILTDSKFHLPSRMAPFLCMSGWLQPACRSFLRPIGLRHTRPGRGWMTSGCRRSP